MRDDRHPLVVRGERAAHVDAEHRELHADESERHAERKEHEALPPGDEASDPPRLNGILFAKGDRVDIDVGILPHAVRVRVVPPSRAAPPRHMPAPRPALADRADARHRCPLWQSAPRERRRTGAEHPNPHEHERHSGQPDGSAQHAGKRIRYQEARV